jgi:hypothetical protein
MINALICIQHIQACASAEFKQTRLCIQLALKHWFFFHCSKDSKFFQHTRYVSVIFSDAVS